MLSRINNISSHNRPRTAQNLLKTGMTLSKSLSVISRTIIIDYLTDTCLFLSCYSLVSTICKFLMLCYWGSVLCIVYVGVGSWVCGTTEIFIMGMMKCVWEHFKSEGEMSYCGNMCHPPPSLSLHTTLHYTTLQYNTLHYTILYYTIT